jgi:hypothetical protein
MEGGKGMTSPRWARWRILVTGVVALGSLAAPAAAISFVAPKADSGTSGPGNAPVPPGFTGINDPDLRSCMEQKHVCNPNAVGDDQTSLSQPGSAGTALIGEAEAMAIARAASGSASASGKARRMSGTEAEAFAQQSRSPDIDGARQVWVVSIDATVTTDGSPAQPPKAVDGYSAIMDAITGEITDECLGCFWVE